MRIISGMLGGRTIQNPPGHKTHPMSERIRGALFNTLGDISGLTVLDAFAGSGALGLEAVSRGAAHTILIEADRRAGQTIAGNIQTLGVGEKVNLIQASANAWLSTTSGQFDLILCDPPYDEPQYNTLFRLAERTKPGGIVVFSLPPHANIKMTDNYELLSIKNYGDAELSFYRRLSGSHS